MFPLTEKKVFKNKLQNIGYIFSTIKSSLLPAVLLLCALLFFYADQPFAPNTSFILHYAFLLLSVFGLTLLYLIDEAKPFFTLLTGLCCYIVINNLKLNTGNSFVLSPNFQCLCLILPLNLCIFYCLPPAKLFNRFSISLFLFLLIEAILVQHFSAYIKYVKYIDVTWETVPLIAYIPWITFFVYMLIDVSLHNVNMNTGIFYATVSLFVGLIYATEPSGLTVFFLIFALILFIAAVFSLYNRYNKDSLEHVYSKNAYLIHAANKFPFKYTVVLFSIDNRDKLLKVIGNQKMQNLEQIIINKIREMPYDVSFYRYNESEIIIVFKNEDAKHVKEFADNIRRTIAAAEFILSNQKKLKITISACVSEKTRKDLNASEVTERAHNALQKNYRFNCNIITVV